MRIATLLACCILFFPISAAVASDYTLVGQVKSRHHTEYLGENRQRLLYAEYDDSGNTQDLMEVDVAKGTVSAVLKGLHKPAIIAESTQYLVYQTAAAYGNKVQVFDKARGVPGAHKYLLSEIKWAHIDGNRLLLLQPGDEEGLVFRLPDLKLMQKSTVVGRGGTERWGNKIVSLGRSLMIYDLAWQELGRVELPKQNDGLSPYSQCAPSGLRIAGDRAVVGAGCRQLAIIDLGTSKVERVVSIAGNFGRFDIGDGLIFSSDSDGRREWVSVTDLSTGEELQQFDISGSVVAVRGTRLVMSRHDFAGPMEVSFYDLDLAALKTPQLRAARLDSACRAAGDKLKKDGNIHAAIEACELAGARGWIGGASIPISLSPVAIQYGRWLADTLSRYEDGKAVLLKVEPEGDALARAEAKIRSMNWPPLTTQPQTKPKSPSVSVTPIEYGSFPDQIHFDGERVYVARWRCSGGKDDGVTLEVLDRLTFMPIKRVPVVACDGVQQDAIESVDIRPESISLGLRYRFPESGRPTLAIVDKAKLEVAKYDYVESGEAVQAPNTMPGVELKVWDRTTSIPDSEAILWSSITDNRAYIRFARYDLKTKQKNTLFELRLFERPSSQAVWRQLAFISLGQDLFVYDLKANALRHFERDPVRAGLKGEHHIERLIVDRDRLIALSYDGAHSFVIDLPAYIAELPVH